MTEKVNVVDVVPELGVTAAWHSWRKSPGHVAAKADMGNQAISRAMTGARTMKRLAR